MKFRSTKLPMSIPGLSDGPLPERFPDSGPSSPGARFFFPPGANPVASYYQAAAAVAKASAHNTEQLLERPPIDNYSIVKAAPISPMPKAPPLPLALPAGGISDIIKKNDAYD